MNRSKKIVYLLFGILELIGIALLIAYPIVVLVLLIKQLLLAAIPVFLLGHMPGVICLAIAKRYKKGHCSRCGASLAGCEYEYHLDSKKTTSTGNITAKVVINAKCPECDKNKKLKVSFLVYDAKKDITYDLQSKVDECCLRFFKH